MGDEDEFTQDKNRRLEALGLRGGPDGTDAECMICGNRFVSYQGHVNEQVSICPYCSDRD